MRSSCCSEVRRTPSGLRPARLLSVLLALCGLLPACAHGPRSAQATAEARHFYYTDDAGLDVNTSGVDVQQPLSRRVSVRVAGLADYLVIHTGSDDGSTDDPEGSDGHSGHVHEGSKATAWLPGSIPEVDVVSSASIPVSSSSGSSTYEKLRLEAIGAVTVNGSSTEQPGQVTVQARASHESDYASASGTLYARREFFQRNTTVAAFLGYGHDTVSPLEAPPGQESSWPASHFRVYAGATAAQLLSPRMTVSGGAAVNFQRGTLSNPYRSALVRTTLFPENLPDARDRYTAFGELSWYAGHNTGLHLRQGIYMDSWGVLALIPEAAVAFEPTGEVLLSVKYRHYTQWVASFYEPIYQDLGGILAGDARLGRITDHVAGLDARWRFYRSRTGFASCAVTAGYSFSRLRYELLEGDPVLSHVLSGGVLASW